MKKDIGRLVRKNIAELVPYSSARDEYTGDDAIFLDANENPYNSPYNRYPDPHQAELKTRISETKGVPVENIFLGNGSDEAIDLLFRVFCEPGKDNVVSIFPTYGMYQVCSEINDVKYQKVPLKDDFSLDPEALVAACSDTTKLLFLCSPNNPTSNSFDSQVILSLVEKLDLIVVVDEAYIDFSSRKSLLQYVTQYPNLVVLQTLSKAWGLAGIRLGMAIGSREVISLMSKVKYPYNLNILTLKFAFKALENKEKVDEWVSLILEQRKLMERKMKMYRFVLNVYPSDANFLLVQVDKPKKIYNYLVEKKIIVRDRSNVELCEGSLRITVGSEAENRALSDALMQYQRDFVESCKI